MGPNEKIKKELSFLIPKVRFATSKIALKWSGSESAMTPSKSKITAFSGIAMKEGKGTAESQQQRADPGEASHFGMVSRMTQLATPP